MCISAVQTYVENCERQLFKLKDGFLGKWAGLRREVGE